MKKTSSPFFSIGISVYNAESFISKTVESILDQTCTDWELILVDDCSSDKSLKILQQYSKLYSNILVYKTPNNTGGAKGPFEIAMSKAHGEYCIEMGHDDQLSSNYLELIKNRIQETQAEVIVTRNVAVDSVTNEILSVLPQTNVDTSKVYSGFEACSLTLPSWRFGANGMVYKRSLFRYVLRENAYTYMNADELSSRILLIHAKRVAFSNAEYTYWQLASSVTHKLSVRLFEGLYLFEELIHFSEHYYNVSLVKPLCNSYLCNLIVLQKKFFAQHDMLTIPAQKRIEFILKDNFKLCRKRYSMFDSLSSKIYGFHYALFKILCYMKTKFTKYEK